jgi:DNA-binding MarR family transcriptional regulator
MDPDRELEKYLAALTGNPIAIQPRPSGNLPLFLRDRFAIASVRLFGKDWVLALERPGWEPLSAGEYQDRSDAIERHLETPVVLVLPALASYTRDRLLRRGVAFIVPGRQAFIPMAVVDLREKGTAAPPAATKLTPHAQSLVLYHLLRRPVTDLRFQELARILATSPMMITRAVSSLERCGLVAIKRQGKERRLVFELSGRALWDRAVPALDAPDRRVQPVSWEGPPREARLAGMSALSRRTLIQEDPRPTYAVGRKAYPMLLARGAFTPVVSWNEADATIEVWSYDPRILTDSPLVDVLSLYVSLRDSPDERVQQQLARMIEDVRW